MRRRPAAARRTLAVCLGLTVLLATGWHRVLRPAAGILEAVLILAAFAVAWRWPPAAEAWRRASKRYRVTAAVVLAGLLAGHLADRNTFPLVQWGMYARVHDDDDPVYEEYIARLASGETMEFHPASLFPALRNAHILRNLQLHVKALRRQEDPERRQVYQATLSALVRLHNRRHPERAIVALDTYAVELPIHPYRGHDAVRREFLWSIALDPEAG